MNYKLKVTETKNKAAKFLYEVVAENGKIISSRKSNREYVAATIHGEFYFGRLDLIGKGDHGRRLKHDEGYRFIYTNGIRGVWVLDPKATPKDHVPIAYK